MVLVKFTRGHDDSPELEQQLVGNLDQRKASLLYRIRTEKVVMHGAGRWWEEEKSL